MSASTLIPLSYALLGIFAVFFVLKSVKMARMPIHLRWELSPVPHEKGKGSYGGSYLEGAEWWTKPREKDHVAEALYMFKEILFLKALFEHKRGLWWFSFPFHIGLYLLTGAAGLLVLGGIGTVTGLVSGEFWLLAIGLPLLVGLGCALGIFGAIGLFITRMVDRGMSNSTTLATYFNVVLIGGLFGTGLWAVFSVPDFTAQVLGFVGALLTANMSVQLAGILTAHFLLAFLFLAYLPFTQMMHFVAKYFTYHEVRWDDNPVEPGGKMEKELLELLGQSPTWAGKHVRADGKKTWVDIATDTGAQEAEK
jgi:nitrate reductase gamma subunit